MSYPRTSEPPPEQRRGVRTTLQQRAHHLCVERCGQFSSGQELLLGHYSSLTCSYGKRGAFAAAAMRR